MIFGVLWLPLVPPRHLEKGRGTLQHCVGVVVQLQLEVFVPGLRTEAIVSDYESKTSSSMQSMTMASSRSLSRTKSAYSWSQNNRQWRVSTSCSGLSLEVIGILFPWTLLWYCMS